MRFCQITSFAQFVSGSGLFFRDSVRYSEQKKHHIMLRYLGLTTVKKKKKKKEKKKKKKKKKIL